jgi:hypothetical protein
MLPDSDKTRTVQYCVKQQSKQITTVMYFSVSIFNLRSFNP